MFWVLVVLTVIDLEHKLLPDRVVYPSIIVGVIALTIAAFVDGDLDRLRTAPLGSATFGGFFFVVAFIYPAGMGMGDVKLALLLGAALGWYVGVGLMLGMLAAMVLGVALMLRHGLAARKMAIPFGPFLAFGAIAALFWGEPILDAYLRLF